MHRSGLSTKAVNVSYFLSTCQHNIKQNLLDCLSLRYTYASSKLKAFCCFSFSQTEHILICFLLRSMCITSLRFFSLPREIGPNDRGPPIKVVIRATMYLPVPGFEPASCEFLDKCVTR